MADSALDTPGCLYCADGKSHYEETRLNGENLPFPDLVVWQGIPLDNSGSYPRKFRCAACGSVWDMSCEEQFVDPRDCSFEPPYIKWIAHRQQK